MPRKFKTAQSVWIISARTSGQPSDLTRGRAKCCEQNNNGSTGAACCPTSNSLHSQIHGQLHIHATVRVAVVVLGWNLVLPGSGVCTDRRISAVETPPASQQLRLPLQHSCRVDFYHRWAVTAREVWGCCLGSNSRWDNGPACSQYNSAEKLCVNAGENAV